MATQIDMPELPPDVGSEDEPLLQLPPDVGTDDDMPGASAVTAVAHEDLVEFIMSLDM